MQGKGVEEGTKDKDLEEEIKGRGVDEDDIEQARNIRNGMMVYEEQEVVLFKRGKVKDSSVV